MRKIRNSQIHTTNPGLLFARGVEQLVDEQIYNPSRGEKRLAPKKPRVSGDQSSLPAGNFFSEFLRQFVF
ncbi:MAG TPA: hypothetical protein VKB27_19910 [Gammaproteobacteria bacterium]|nr:hypothetical protein [Gammaproteobacteria bacterium]